MEMAVQKEVLNFYAINDFKVRPNASNGLWVLFLLPMSLIISSFKNPVTLSSTYKLIAFLAITLSLSSVIILLKTLKKQKLDLFNRWILLILLLTIILFYSFLQKGFLCSTLSGIFSTFFYFRLYVFILKEFENCFTLGEAGLVSQGCIILLYSTFSNILNSMYITPGSRIEISTLIIQIGLLAIGILSILLHLLNIRNPKSFYLLTAAVITCGIIWPLHILLRRNPLTWIINWIFGDLLLLKLFIYWSFCTGIAILAVNNQIIYARKASTSLRKNFHILAVVVFIPGLLYRCSFLYLASGVMLGIFFYIEILRVLNIPPLGLHLQDGFTVFSDEKDIGALALTPIYLLAGCSLPLWIHPSPCDVTDSAMFHLLPLLSGLLSVGVGDTAASIIGSNFGKHFWPGSKKTIEGTVAFVIAQVVLVYLLDHFGLANLSLERSLKLYLSIVVGSLVEARTTQVDNLVLPLVMYIILI